MDYFYRFRSAKALLDDFHELEKQEIYFSTVKELNDPLEGYKDVIWRGDHIVWRNLFRHYLLCLMRVVLLAAVSGDEFRSDMATNFVFETDVDLPAAPIRALFAKACDLFLGNESIDALIRNIAQSGRSIRQHELKFYLALLHPSALAIIFELLEAQGAKLTTSTDNLAKLAAQAIGKVGELLRLPLTNEQADVAFFVSDSVASELALKRLLNNSPTEAQQSWLFVVQDFPSHHVKAIEQLLYPEWYTACFVAEATDASMWGNYGDGHKGMCLKFRAKPTISGGSALDLRRPTSWSGDGKIGYSYVPHTFEPVQYTTVFPEIDFFRCLGRVTLPKLSHFWYAGPNGERSEAAAGVLGENETWRQDYWQRFSEGYRVKLPPWSHEKEYRLALSSTLADFQGVESRKLQYRFEDLAAVVFGLRTPDGDKIAAMQIIQRKCKEMGRGDFEFWQANYVPRFGKIELLRLGLANVGAAN